MAGAGALVPLLGSAFDFMASENRNENQIHLAKLNHKWNVEMWNANNAYNAPIEQKRRLEQAGINPYSVMAGDGSDTGNSSSPAESTTMPNLVTPPSFASAGMDLLNAIKVAKETEGQQIANDSAAMNLAFQETRTYLDISEQRARIKETLSRSDLNDEQRNYLETQDRVLQSQEYYILKKSRAEANQADTVSQNLQRQYDDEHDVKLAEQELTKQNIRLSKTQQAQLRSAIAEANERIRQLKKQGQLTDKQIKVAQEEIYTQVLNRVLNKARYRLEAERTQGDLTSLFPNASNSSAGSSFNIGAIVGSVVSALVTRGASTGSSASSALGSSHGYYVTPSY